jgi:26S proteasome regulatory subunit N9
MLPIQYLEAIQVKYPNLAVDVAQIAELYDRKLWHQLTVKLEEVLAKPEFHEGDLLIQLYRNFIASAWLLKGRVHFLFFI